MTISFVTAEVFPPPSNMFNFPLWAYANILLKPAELRRCPLIDGCHGALWYWGSINVGFCVVAVHVLDSNV